jgi:hypothetical protein
MPERILARLVWLMPTRPAVRLVASNEHPLECAVPKPELRLVPNSGTKLFDHELRYRSITLFQHMILSAKSAAFRRSRFRSTCNMTLGIAHLQPIVSLIAGILILVMPQLLNYIVAIFLIVSGILGLGLFK